MFLFLLAVLVLPGLAGGAVRTVIHGADRFVRLEDMAAFYGGELIPSPTTERVTIRARGVDAIFKPDSRELKIGSTLVWLHEPMIRVRGSWVILENDAWKTLDPILRPAHYLSKFGYRVIVLDAGHGGADTGAKGRRGMEEKRAALDITRRVRSHLIAAGHKVYMTRENDHFIELEERANMARRWGGDLFVSIHLNSAASTLAQGVETFVLANEGLASTAGGSKGTPASGNRFNAANSILGFMIHRSVIKKTSAIDRGLKRARFIVLRNAACPAVLVECGFLSHADEERKLSQEQYREEVASGIASGILNYVNLTRKSQKAAKP